jgi:hypothetical protein
VVSSDLRSSRPGICAADVSSPVVAVIGGKVQRHMLPSSKQLPGIHRQWLIAKPSPRNEIRNLFMENLQHRVEMLSH